MEILINKISLALPVLPKKLKAQKKENQMKRRNSLVHQENNINKIMNSISIKKEVEKMES